MVEGLLIVPDWERRSYGRLREVVGSSSFSFLGSEKLEVGRRFNWKRDVGLDELIEKHGSAALRKVKKRAEKIGANLAFIHSTRGYGWLGVNASYYSI